jgi:translocator protein
MAKNNFFKLIITLVACQLAGIIGSIFTVSAIPCWYAQLLKPELNPPNWIFGPAWTILYILMGISAFLIWKKGFEKKEIKIALTVFIFQLFLNAIWSIIFFGLKNPFWAFIEIIILWLAILGTIIIFYKISKPAAILLIPYIFWVSFAAYLNYSIWQLNIEDATILCAADAKLCQDGSYVSRVPPKCRFALCPKEDLIIIDNPEIFQKIFSPLFISGKAKGF